MAKKPGTIEKTLGELIAEDTRIRIQPREINGKTYWFKRYLENESSIYLTAHRLFSFLLVHPFLKANPVYTGVDALNKEIERMEAFQEAGFGVPEIMAHKESILVTKDLGEIFDDELRGLKAEEKLFEHDDLLCEWVREFGLVHASGLVHGRPHPRDTAYKNDKWIFFDFEENPQEVMQLKTAQARDLFLIFHILNKRMRDQDNLKYALEAYRENAPQEVLDEVRKILRGLTPILAIGKLIMKIRAGKDLQRFVKAADFLKNNL